MLISTWNVNGLRSIISKNFNDYLNDYLPDILCLQEIKANLSDVEQIIHRVALNYDIVLNSAQKKGYSGTAILVKKSLVNSNYKIDTKIEIEKFDSEGRFTHFESPSVSVLNGYFPNGQRDHSRVDYKLEFSNEVLKKAQILKKNKTVIITGDLNTAHQEIDLKNPKSNLNTTGFLPIERAFLDKMINDGFIDVFREKNPTLKDAYTWWTYRSNCREKNIGWRLDYFFIDKNSYDKVKKIEIMKDVLGSDHCPVHLTIEV
jgi:exodeoxyribonuclease-3